MNFSKLSIPQRVSAVAMIVVAVAAFLPWVSIFGISVRGTEGDGVITLLAGIAGLAVLALTSGVVVVRVRSGKVSHIAQLALAGVVTLVGLIDMNGAAAIGLYLTLFGGIGWLVGALWQLAVTTPTSPEIA